MDHNVLSDPSRWRGAPAPKPPEPSPPDQPLAPPVVRPPRADEVFPAPRELLLDSGGRLNQDLGCRQCGYNLRGLAIVGNCPECQTPIGKSVRPDLLRFAVPRWVDRLATGMLWIIIGIIAEVVGSMALGVAFTMLGAVMGGVRAVGLIAALGIAIAGLASIKVIGYWMVTTPDPSTSETEPQWTVRRVARWGLTATLISAPVSALTSQGTGGGAAAMQSLSSFGWLIGGLSLLASAALLIGMFALFTYAARIAMRIPEAGLARQCRIVKWGMAICTGVGAIYGFVIFLMLPTLLAAMAAGPATIPPSLAIIGALGCLFGVPTLVFQIWSIILMFRFRSQFSGQAAIARATWAEDAMPGERL